MKIFGLVDCRSIRRCRVELGDPAQDVYEYQIYSFMGHRDFDLQQYSFRYWAGNWDAESDMACVISRKDDLLELGDEYLISLSDAPPGAALYCGECVPNGPNFDIGFKAEAHPRDAKFWPATRLTVRSKVALSVGETYYLDFPNG